MASFSLTDATTYIHAFDFTAKTNQISVDVTAEDLESTVFGQSWRSRVAGLRDISGDHSGYWDSDVDEAAYADLGAGSRVVSVSPTGAEDSIAYMYRAGSFTYEQFGQVGDLTPFSLSMQGTDALGVVRGRLAAKKQTVSETGAVGSVLELGAISSSQHLYAALHVFGTPGTTITVKIESDDDDDFASATTRGTVGTVTAAGGTWMTPVAGAITDTFWRANVTAITGSFDIAVAIAIA